MTRSPGSGGYAPAPTADRNPAPAQALLRLQRSAGNGAVVATLRAHHFAPLADAARKANEAKAAGPASPDAPGVHFRVPLGSDLKTIHDSGLLTEADFEDAVRRAIKRLDRELFVLRTDTDEVMGRLFPGGDVFDEDAAKSIFGTDDTDEVYRSVADEEAKLQPEDKARLKALAPAILREMEAARNDDAGLADVFGSKAKLAKLRYGKGMKAFSKVIAHIDTAMDADYNRDADQVDLGGWANFQSQHIHMLASIAQVKDRNSSIITLIHESMHLSDPDVGDHGYYGQPGFESKSDETKVNNAAHYEELPRRNLGMSSYAMHPEDPLSPFQTFKKFTPGKTAGGGTQTFEDHVREDVDIYMNTAWDSALNVLDFVRGAARRLEASTSHAYFNAHLEELLTISRCEQLTIHKQKPKPSTVNTLDVALSEGVARGVNIIWGNARKQPAPTGTNRKAEVSKMINGAIGDYGALLDSVAQDRKLMDWLVKHDDFPWG